MLGASLKGQLSVHVVVDTEQDGVCVCVYAHACACMHLFAFDGWTVLCQI